MFCPRHYVIGSYATMNDVHQLSNNLSQMAVLFYAVHYSQYIKDIKIGCNELYWHTYILTDTSTISNSRRKRGNHRLLNSFRWYDTQVRNFSLYQYLSEYTWSDIQCWLASEQNRFCLSITANHSLSSSSSII